MAVVGKYDAGVVVFAVSLRRVQENASYAIFEGVAGALCLVADLRAAATRRSFFPGFGLPRKRQAFSPIPIPVPLKK